MQSNVRAADRVTGLVRSEDGPPEPAGYWTHPWLDQKAADGVRRVVLKRPVAAGELIEKCPVAVIGASLVRGLPREVLAHCTPWLHGGAAAMLGWAGAVRQAVDAEVPNVAVGANYDSGFVAVTALADIPAGAELIAAPRRWPA